MILGALRPTCENLSFRWNIHLILRKKCKTIEGKHITGKMPKDSGKFANKTMVPIHLILDTKAEVGLYLQIELTQPVVVVRNFFII